MAMQPNQQSCGRIYGERDQMTHLVSALDRTAYDTHIAAVVAAHEQAFVTRTCASFPAAVRRGVLQEREIPTHIHEVTRSIIEMERPPIFRADPAIVRYVWLSLRNRVFSIVSPRSLVDRNSVPRDGDEREDADRVRSQLLAAKGFGAPMSDERMDMRMTFTKRKPPLSPLERRALFSGTLIAMGYKVREFFELSWEKELSDSRVQAEIAKRLGDEALEFVPEFLVMLAKLTSEGAIGNDAARGKRMLAQLTDWKLKPAAKRPRAIHSR